MKRRVRFLSEQGFHLAGLLHLPAEAPPYGAVVFAHGWDSGKDSPRNIPIAAELNARGLAAFLIDFTGHGESEGEREQSTIEQQTSDLQAAINFLSFQPEIDRHLIGINGSSSGALAAVRVAVSDERVKSLVLRAPRTDELGHLAKSVITPTLIVQGSLDPLLSQTELFNDQLVGESRLQIIEGGTHLFEDEGHFQTVVQATVDWFERTLVPRHEEASSERTRN